MAWVVPLSREDVIDSVTFSIAFFATLLTGEAVIFALSFSASSAWPSFREIDGHIGFRDWVVTGWLGAMLTAAGLLAEAETAATYGALLFLLADAVRDVLLHPAARAGQLGRAQAAAGADPRPGAARSGRRAPGSGSAGREAVLAAYLGQLDQAASGSDGGGVQDLADELASAAADNRDARPGKPGGACPAPGGGAPAGQGRAGGQA